MAAFSLTLLGLSAIASAFAVPAPAPVPTAAPDLAKRATTCTFYGSSGASLASKSKNSCATIILSAIAVPSGVTLDLTGLNSGTHVEFVGETTFGFEQWSGPLFAISGTDIVVTSAPGAILNGNGGDYWDGLGVTGKVKPKFFQAHDLITSSITGVYILNAPLQVFSISSATTLSLTDITVDNTAGNSLGANTDGFDIGSSTGVTITGAKIYNQDDCVAVNSGSNIVFTGGFCSGGHGLSVGSVGGRSDNVVDNVIFENSEVKDSQNGIRIKTVSGGTGSVTSVKYNSITLSGITEYGVTVRQDYEGTGKPTNGIPIKNFILDNISGTVDSSGYNYYIVCGVGSCSDWTWTYVDVTGGQKSTGCENLPSGISC